MLGLVARHGLVVAGQLVRLAGQVTLTHDLASAGPPQGGQSPLRG